MRKQIDCIAWRNTAVAMVIVMVLVVLMDIVQFSLDKRLAAKEAPVAQQIPMTPWEQCMTWNKWAEWPKRGSCPGDLQPRWYR